eukprot:TRINITY_DN24820_c0_g1_i1.p1 TRINITY_DN24820_c0_g1~~TRINITY_DN24820_c0_g1_i1.p1  ORF type:complete len:102 (+),score=2.96 TRINITY_DN24820_c0_g1_i1:1005-1310(+)
MQLVSNHQELRNWGILHQTSDLTQFHARITENKHKFNAIKLLFINSDQNKPNEANPHCHWCSTSRPRMTKFSSWSSAHRSSHNPLQAGYLARANQESVHTK